MAKFTQTRHCFAWLGNFRRLLIRWEHLGCVCRSFFTVAVLLVCLQRAYSPSEGDGR